MKKNIKPFLFLLILSTAIFSCKKDTYTMGALLAPTEVTINAAIAGQDGTHPNGDGSGDVTFTLSGKNVLAYKIDYDASNGIQLEFLPKSTVTKKYTTVGLHTYRVTVVAYGAGGSATTITKDITLRSDFTPDPSIVDDLVGTGSKTWVVERNAAGNFGVGPWDPTSVTPAWWSSAPNEKADCCSCFYTASFTFKKNQDGTFSLTTATPNGAFTKTGDLAGGLPGIPGSGPEACYDYSGGTSGFTFVPSSSGVDPSQSTKTAILLAGNNTFIGYGAVLKEYEILSISETNMYLRVQGTETGNAWYLKMIPQ